MAAILQLTIDPGKGPVTLRLQAEKALPIKGVLSCRDVGHLDPTDVGDASIVEWQLPPSTALYVTYGIVLPLKSVWFAPAYNRLLLQGGTLLSAGSANPRRFKTEQHADGEWVGPPDAFRIVVQGA